MGKPAGRGSSLSNQMKRSDDVDAIARAIGQQERMSFLSTELARTEGLGFLARQQIANEVGVIAARSDRDAMQQMASECNTQAELDMARDFAEPLHKRTVRRYDEFVARAFGQE